VKPTGEDSAQHVEGEPAIFFGKPLDVSQRVTEVQIENLYGVLDAQELVWIGVERRTQRDNSACPGIGGAAGQEPIDGPNVAPWDTTNDLTRGEPAAAHHALDGGGEIVWP